MQRPRDHKDTLKIVNNPLTIYGQRIVNNPLTISKRLIIKTIEIVRILYCESLSKGIEPKPTNLFCDSSIIFLSISP